MDDYTLIIIAAIVGFALLTVLLLAPVYYFLQREKRHSAEWTAEALVGEADEERAPLNGHRTSGGVTRRRERRG